MLRSLLLVAAACAVFGRSVPAGRVQPAKLLDGLEDTDGNGVASKLKLLDGLEDTDANGFASKLLDGIEDSDGNGFLGDMHIPELSSVTMLKSKIGKTLDDADLQKRANTAAIDLLVDNYEKTSDAASTGIKDSVREQAVTLRKFVPNKIGILPTWPCGVHAQVVGAGHCDPPRTVWNPRTCRCIGDLSQCDEDSNSTGVVACEDEEIDLAFVIDGSGSIGSGRFTQMKAQVSEIVTGLTIGSGAEEIQVAANSFSCSNCHAQTTANFPLNAHSSESAVKAAIEGLKFHGSSTYTGNALQWTIENQMKAGAPGRRPGVPGAIIVITDGRPTGNQMQKAAEQAQIARRMGIKVFAIGVGGTYNLQNLEDMASQPHADTVYELQNFDVAAFKDQLLTEICNNTDTGPASAWIQAVKFGNTHTNCHANGAGESFEGEKTQAECRALCERNHRCVATVQADRSGRGKVTGRENCWLKNRCDEVAHREGRLVSFHFNRQAALNHMRLLPMM